MWDSINALRTLSQTLTWVAFVFAVIAAAATVARYFVDRRGNELKAAAAAEAATRNEADRKAREAALLEQIAPAEVRVLAAEGKAAAAADTSERLRLIQQPRAERVRAARADLIKSLRAVPPLHARFAAFAGDTEAQELAAELHGLFGEAGWTVGPIDGIMAPGNPQGVLLRYGTGNRSGTAALAALRSAGLEVEDAAEKNRPDIEISVYFKPRRR